MMRLRREDPRVVGPYRLHRRLGTGGMGVVYLGSDRKGQKVALKLIRSELAEDQEFRTRFAREVSAAARIRGGCIARLVASDIDAERPWLATSYVPGPSLYKRVGDEGPLPWPEVTAIGAALADGLVHVHEAGVVHRDLKPSNILLSPKGPRIIDFGIAWSTGASTLTHVGTAVGSPGFLAPEQVRGIAVTSATDVFALGTTLAYAATGDSPFGSGSSEVMLYRVVHEEPDLTDVPGALLQVIRACLEKEAADRPTTAQLHDRLRELTARGTAIGLSQLPRPQQPAQPTASGVRTGGATGRPRPAEGQQERSGERTAGRPPTRPADRTGRPPGEHTDERFRERPSGRAGGGTGAGSGTGAGAGVGERRGERPGERPAARPVRPGGRRPMPPTMREPQPAAPPPTAVQLPRPQSQRTPPPGRPGGTPARRRRLLRQRLIVFVTVTVLAALAIAAAQGCEDRNAQGLGRTTGAVPAPSDPPVPVSKRPAADAAAAAGQELTAVPSAAGRISPDWSDRDYTDPSDGSAIRLKDGRWTSPDPSAGPVTLTAVLPARFRGAAAAVVVLTRRDGTVPEDLVELFGLSPTPGAEPVLLASHASTGDPQATSSWQIVDGAVLREEHTTASGTRPASTTRYVPLANGTMTETWPGTGAVAGQQG